MIHGLALDGGKSALAAYDKRTGEVLGQVSLPGTIVGTPMTYSIDNIQYIAATVRVGRSPGSLVALRLPD
ncbi:MAG TPA: hypothetical protein EYN96_02745 [Candidatus Hydrogenedentes bacterium]|nr:hypothetical protein [Candidatus Hydrogenedentota bacterium]